jgi:hypothetical protein
VLAIAFSNEADTGSREEKASKQDSGSASEKHNKNKNLPLCLRILRRILSRQGLHGGKDTWLLEGWRGHRRGVSRDFEEQPHARAFSMTFSQAGKGVRRRKRASGPSGAKSPLLQATGDGCRYELINHKPLK